MDDAIRRAITILADELGTCEYAGMQGESWNCRQANALASVLALAGFERTAWKVIFWHTDSEPEHHDPSHAEIREAQRDTGSRTRNPVARELAEHRVRELLDPASVR